MASNPEATFVKYINTRLDKRIYTEGMCNPMRGGTPDRYYEARKILWVEYKFCKTIPKTFKLYERVSALQHLWLDRCYMNGHQCAVIAGFGFEHVLIAENLRWKDTFDRDELHEITITRKEAITWIQDKVL